MTAAPNEKSAYEVIRIQRLFPPKIVPNTGPNPKHMIDNPRHAQNHARY